MIGGTTSQALDLTLLNKGDIVYGTSTIKVEIGLKIGSTIEYIPIGIYNIDDIEKTDYTIKITAYDNMIKFEKNFTTSLGDTLTLQQVASELTRITGVEFTGSLPSYTVKKLEGFSCREVLGYVASLCGGNAVITRDGKFAIVTPKDVNYSIGTSNYFEYKREETKYKIGKISCQVGEEVLSKGSLGTDSMELEFENPWVTDSILQDIYNKLNGFEYLGYSMKWQGDVSLDVGDIVTITDKKGVVRKHPILSQKLTYTGGLTSEIGAKGETKNKNSFSSSGSTAKKVERAVMELAIINKALIDKANIYDLKATNAEIANLKAKDVEMENALIKKANIEDLTAINASIASLIAADANITNLIATKADITDLTAINIKFNVASGGTLDLQTLLSKHITGENGQFLNITSSNTVIANATIKDAMIENLSLNKVLAGTISTNKFNISSDDGGITIVGPTMQFKDKSNKVRLQLGQDTTGDFNFILRAADGTTTLIDGYGIKEKAIADDLIKSNMVAADAIGEKQINYSSFVTGLNKDTNTSLIKASKVAIDLTGQSLEVSFNSLKSNVDNMEIGGRNLLRKTSKDYVTVTMGVWNYRITVFDISDYGLKVGDTLTFRLYVKNESSTYKIGARLTCYKSDGSKIVKNSITTDIDVNSEGYSTVQITIPSETTYLFVGLQRTDAASDAPTFSFQYKEAKLEKGTKATDWTPAPEDTEEKIEANTTSISIAQGQISGLISENAIIKGDITTISDKYTSLKATVDGINTTVASHTTSITTIQGTANSALANANTANNKIDNLEVGGRNLVYNSTGNLGVKGWTNNGVTNFTSVEGGVEGNSLKLSGLSSDTARKNISQNLMSKFIDLNNLKYVTLSFWYKASLDSNKTGVGSFLRISNKNSQNNDVLRSTDTLIIDNEWHYKTVTEDLSRFNNTGITSIVLFFFTYLGTVEYANIKLEFGMKDTDWTPAPEDVDSSISTVDTKVTTVENKYTSLEQNLEGFKTIVASNYSTKTELSNLSGTVSSINSRVTTAESSITQLNNKIALKVEATDITNAINELEIGGRNLIENSDFKNTSSSPFVAYNSLVTIINDSQGNVLKVEKTSTAIGGVNTGSYLPTRNLITNAKYSYSAWVRADSNTTIYMALQGAGITKAKSFNITTSWQRITVEAEKYIANNTSFRFYSSDTVTFYIAKPMLEQSTKCGNWTLALEDIDSAITTVDTKIETTSNKVASIETNLSSITSRVSSTESSISTINGNVSSLQSRITSAEQKITDSSIVSIVTSSTSYINDLNSKANQSALNAANSNITNLTTRMSSAETKLTATSLTTTISSAINGGTSSITTTQFVMDKTGLTVKNGALTVINSNGVITIDGSKQMFRLRTWGNGSIVLASGETTKQVMIKHGLGYSPMFRGQFRFANSRGVVETYENNMALLNWSTGTVNISGRIWADDTNIYIAIWRSSSAASAGQQTFYYRYFIEEGVNL